MYIDDTLIDLYDTSENVQAKIDLALKVPNYKADIKMTE